VSDDIITEQINYYRRRAAEYDVTSSPPDDPLAAFANKIERALQAFRPSGDVLEIASGTGTWTGLLLEHASTVTALDAAPEMHQESCRKLGDDPRVRYIEADVLSWEPDRTYDVVFFANWLSHVPPARFDHFWATVLAATAPEARVFFIDEIGDAWRREELLREDFVRNHSVPIVRRRLLDGTVFNVVKVFWDPHDLRARLSDLGWEIQVCPIGPFFWAHGMRKPSH
jgi:SAM-dependent methyltransferase